MTSLDMIRWLHMSRMYLDTLLKFLMLLPYIITKVVFILKKYSISIISS